MMKKVSMNRASVCAVILLSVAALAGRANGQAAFVKNAFAYSATFARAMDECNPTTLTVSAPAHLPADGCQRANVVTQDDTLTWNYAKVIIQDSGRITLIGRKFPFGQRAFLELTLRVTRSGVSTNMGSQSVTFPDVTVDCGDTPVGFVANRNTGAISGHTTLTACLGASNSGLAGPNVNIEVISSALLDPDSGNLVFGVPGNVTRAAGFIQRGLGVTTWLARAMDECTAPTLTVLTPNLPAAACPQANAVTDDTLTLTTMRLIETQTGRMTLYGRGLALGDALRVHLNLRVTRTGVTTNLGTQDVTFSDVSIDCPKAPDAFVVGTLGTVLGTTALSACLDPNAGLAQGNVEILDASVVNVINGETVAVPGLRH